MNPVYILELSTKARGPNRKNLMNMLAHRFTSPFIVKREGQLTIHLYVHEDDDSVAERVQSFIEYATQHVPSTKVTIRKPESNQRTSDGTTVAAAALARRTGGSVINKADFDQLKAIIEDPVKRVRLRELVLKALEHRINIEDFKSDLEGLEWSAKMDLKIDPSIYARLVTKASRKGDVMENFDALLEEVLNDIEKLRTF